jgi:hypothetical protein
MLPPRADNQPLQVGSGLTALAVRSSANALAAVGQAPSVDRLDKLKAAACRQSERTEQVGERLAAGPPPSQ